MCEILRGEQLSLVQNSFTSLLMETEPFSNVVPQTRPFTKGQWTLEEDQKLMRLVDEHGSRRWSTIANALPGRMGKQCRERWYNHLRPDIKKDAWTADEEAALVRAHMQIGNRWAEIAKMIPGRTENSIKNHWNATKRRQLSKRNNRKAGEPQSTVLEDYIRNLDEDIDYKGKGKLDLENGGVSPQNKPLTGQERQIQGSFGNNMPCIQFPVNQMQNNPFLVNQMQNNMVAGQSNMMYGDADLSAFLTFPDPSTFPSTVFVPGLGNPNPLLGIDDIPKELDNVMKELGFVEMVSNSVDIGDW